jgi:hypothetical protein
MKKHSTPLLISLALILLIPSVAFASWWNPLSWGYSWHIFGGLQKQQDEIKNKNWQVTLYNLSTSTLSTATTTSPNNSISVVGGRLKKKVQESVEAQTTIVPTTGVQQIAQGRKDAVVKAYQTIIEWHISFGDQLSLDIQSIDRDLGMLYDAPSTDLVNIQRKLTSLRRGRITNLYKAHLKIIDALKYAQSSFRSDGLESYEKHDPDSFITALLSDKRKEYDDMLSSFEKDKNEYRVSLEKTKIYLNNSPTSQNSVNNYDQSSPATSIGTPAIVIKGQFRSELTNFSFTGRTDNDTTGIRSSCIFPNGDTISIANWMVGDNEIRAEVGGAFGSDPGTYLCHFSIDGTNIRSPNITIEVQ